MSSAPIAFNKPFIIGRELDYIGEAVAAGKIAGDGLFTQRCHRFFESHFGMHRALLTTSCTAALEMAAILLNIAPGDEVLMPSFTFVSTANAFVLRGAKIVFVDSCAHQPHLDVASLEALITPRTRALVVMHYAGIACDMAALLALAQRYQLPIVEDAAQAIDAYWNTQPLGTLGDFGTFSFHETKNVIAGEGGLLAINRPRDVKRAEIIREKGTNRSAFYRQEVQKYSWVDIGSSYLPSELTAAYLYAQLEQLSAIQQRRRALYARYASELHSLESKGVCFLPHIPPYARANGHIFYLLCETLAERDRLLKFLAARHIHAVFHYVPLHSSPYYQALHDGRRLPNAERFAACLVRLPLYYSLSAAEQERIIKAVRAFFAA